MNLKLQGKTAIVCASSKGIGHAVALGLAREGVNILVNSRNSYECDLAASSISSKCDVEVLSVPGDLANPETTESLVDNALGNWGKIDILFINCGGPPSKSFLETTDNEWDTTYQANLMSAIRLSRLVAPHMIANNWGRIITLGSSLMKEPSPKMVLSCSIRAALLCFMKSISYDLAPHGITVNTISTGGVDTERLRNLFLQSSSEQNKSLEESLRVAADGIPIKRFASPEEFSQAIIFLASELSSYITGECLSIDGGLAKSAF